jgi:hypothetical protein
MADTPILDALNEAVTKATHLGVLDKPAVEAARALARKIDLMDEYFDALADDVASRNLRPPSVDNVSLPTFLKYCDALGLTPAGRSRQTKETQPAPENGGAKGGNLSRLRSVGKGA